MGPHVNCECEPGFRQAAPGLRPLLCAGGDVSRPRFPHSPGLRVSMTTTVSLGTSMA